MTNAFTATAAALTGALIAGATFAPAPAMAGQHIGGYDVISINESNGRYSPDFMVVVGPAGAERITVTCGQGPYDSAFDWSSHGPNSSDWVDYVARQWCF